MSLAPRLQPGDHNRKEILITVSNGFAFQAQKTVETVPLFYGHLDPGLKPRCS
jgi:hypothetical protein